MSDWAKGRYRAPALRTAAQAGSIPFIDWLVSLGPGIDDSDSAGWTPLMCAAKSGKEYAALRILELGGDPRTRDREGYAASDLAAMSGHAQLAEVLQEEAARSEDR